MTSSPRATLIGSTAILMWGTLATLTVLSGDIPPFQLLAMAFSLATLIGFLWPAGPAATRDAAEPAIAAGRWSALRLPLPVWALGIYGLFGYHFAYFMALRLAPPVEANLINYLWPLLIVLLSGLLPGERLGARQVGGALAGFAGAALLVARGGGLRFDGQYAAGYAFALACAVIWSSYSVLSRRVGAAAETGVVLKVTPNDDSPILLVDPERLEGVLSNLTANALRHTPAGGHVTLSAAAVAGGAALAVADSGEGIAADELPFVFDRFWRGDRSRGRTAGAGLGLAIARQLVLAHGGTIEVSSAVGQGTTFSIFLPLK